MHDNSYASGMMNQLILLVPTIGIALSGQVSSTAATTAENWCGEFDYKGFASRAPMNISITGVTATVNQVWDRKAYGCHQCCPETELGLKVTRTATHLTLLGNGKDA